MIINKKRKSKKKLICGFLAIGIIVSTSTAGAATYTANLNGSSNTAKTTTVTANKNKTSKIYATNSGANTTTQGYAKRSVVVLPDSTVASTGWMNPGKSKTVYFSQKKGKKYYGQISGQTRSSRGGVRLTMN
ncbi:hypothetical protein [Virgibacillus pantothenticus]|uniref:hypothetical protein n=1 Tax=Virgibacillus pantothenticus TaxID=1473 RepID=UPI0009875972|nr:hypothetical protein [Virgibacillus pantothenticus]